MTMISGTAARFAATLPWPRITPLGSAVVPDVYISTAVSSAPTVGRSAGGALAAVAVGEAAAIAVEGGAAAQQLDDRAHGLTRSGGRSAGGSGRRRARGAGRRARPPAWATRRGGSGKCDRRRRRRWCPRTW